MTLRPVLLVALLGVCAFSGPEAHSRPARAKGKVDVPKNTIRIDDGDSLEIRWADKTVEVVRILGIDTPEVMHLNHDIPYDQPFGREARGFLRGAIATATKVTLERSGEIDPFGRTLAYAYADDQNVSVLLIKARLAVETVSHYGDNGMPVPAKACIDAAKSAGPVAFEAPYKFRKRMRAVSAWLKANHQYPAGPKAADTKSTTPK